MAPNWTFPLTVQAAWRVAAKASLHQVRKPYECMALVQLTKSDQHQTPMQQHKVLIRYGFDAITSLQAASKHSVHLAACLSRRCADLAGARNPTDAARRTTEASSKPMHYAYDHKTYLPVLWRDTRVPMAAGCGCRTTFGVQHWPKQP